MRGYFRLNEAAEDEFAEEIRAAQLSAAFRLLPIAVAVNAINGVITATVLHRLADGERPLVWQSALRYSSLAQPAVSFWRRVSCLSLSS